MRIYNKEITYVYSGHTYKTFCYLTGFMRTVVYLEKDGVAHLKAFVKLKSIFENVQTAKETGKD